MTVWIRAQVTRATRDIAPLWPLHSFIAINPLAAHEATAFSQAERAGVALTRTRSDYLRDLDAGRITSADLEAALSAQIPELVGAPDLILGDRRLTAPELLIAELTNPELHPDETRSPAAPVSPVDDRLVKWLAAYLDPHPAWPMPRRSEGLYAAWRALARHDADLPRAARRQLRDLPPSAETSLAATLEAFGIDADGAAATLRAELASLPGWVSHMKWREEHLGDIDLLEYLAVRLATKRALGAPLAEAEPPSETDPIDEVWQRAHDLVAAVGLDTSPAALAAVVRVLGLHPRAQHRFTLQLSYELHYRRELLTALPSGSAPAGAAPAAAATPASSVERRDAVNAEPTAGAPTVQFIACIDPRSEGIRRHLETENPAIETLGFAGFFGVPFRYTSLGSADAIDVLPALLSPRHGVTEKATEPSGARRWTERLRARRALSAGFHAAETSPAAPYALAELSGPVMGIHTALKTFAPVSAERWSNRLRRAVAAKPDTVVTVDEGFTLDERVGLAEAALRTMGLGRFAPLVVIAGHGSTSANNLYQSAQHCGACGGNRGDANARAAAAMFNDPAVRQALSARGLAIPDDTHFVAAEHDTVTDRVEVLDAHLVPASHRSFVQQFTTTAARASEALVRERAPHLPGAPARKVVQKTRSRSADWAEVYPEWGLVGNAAIVVGPREMTAGVSLNRRVFLHSYRPQLDPTGAGLETILTAPVVVAQWINHQYYFSALNPDTLGAGTKTTHNAIGTLGVLSGQSGDLRRGLPWQSVGVGDALVHEPMRLAVIVEAPLERITEIIDRNTVLRSLFTNGWISLTARTDAASPWFAYGEYGWETPAWLPAHAPASAPAAPAPAATPAASEAAAGSATATTPSAANATGSAPTAHSTHTKEGSHV